MQEISGGTLSYGETTKMLLSWLKEFAKKNPPPSGAEDFGWSNNQYIFKWLTNDRNEIKKNLALLRQNTIAGRAKALALEDATVWSSIILETINSLPAEQRHQITQQLIKGVHK